jgi:hypothetical protein
MQPTPKTDVLQRYGADLSDFSHSQERVRKMLDDAHAHYEAQVRPLGGLARPDTKALFAALEDARKWFGEALALKLALAGTDIRVAALREAMKDAARTLEGAHLAPDGQEVAYTVAKGLRRAAE